jgi:P27 family predicted phage terminase small subunit
MCVVRGRKPKPVEQKIAEGNPGKRPLPEVLLIAGRPDLQELAVAPAHLPRYAREFWSATIVELVKVGVVDRIDVSLLEQLAVQYCRIRQAQDVLAEDGLFARGSTGQIREHPAVKIEREATTLFMRLAEGFGIGAMARARLGLTEVHRRSLAQEMEDMLGPMDMTPIDVEVVEDAAVTW